MEKRKPHYDLEVVKVDVARLGVAAFTRSALDGGRALGLTSAEMLAIVQGLSRRVFYKSMTTYADSRLWQDVYHPTTDCGIELYVKVTCRPEGPPVISFKERT
ncbi:type II toxin-antitoxin system MqsR family toxin [Pseudomonas sp. USHLN015]|uniref:type II toxin-antitoxin system MqsR family toxin n=1 Tax=Pseudomonas sp. USHLN015 TaxID=3081296 RepID=UPI00301C6368